MKIPIEVSARHIHLCQKDLEKLFGKGYQLNKFRDLTQPGNFASQETLTIKSDKAEIGNVRIVGPLRDYTQIEFSLTDAIFLGVEPVIRKSGNLDGTPGILLISPKAELKLKKDVIIPWRHIHINKTQASELELKEDDLVSVRVENERGLVFNNIMIRIDENSPLVLHLDTDEGNACGITQKGEGDLIL